MPGTSVQRLLLFGPRRRGANDVSFGFVFSGDNLSRLGDTVVMTFLQGNTIFIPFFLEALKTIIGSQEMVG